MIFGAPSHLFASPLVKWFETQEAADGGFSLQTGSPAELAKTLLEGVIDCALLGPLFTFLHPAYKILEGPSVWAEYEIRSARYYSVLPIVSNQSVASRSADPSSLALLSIVLAEKHNSFPQQVIANEGADLHSLLKLADSAFIEGDLALKHSDREIRSFDLGEEWRKLTATPIVQSVWITNPNADTNILPDIVNTSKDWGLSNLDAIAKEESVKIGLPEDECMEYLREVLQFGYNNEQKTAIEIFRKKCREHALLTK
jgi:predicted solute-binding protein